MVLFFDNPISWLFNLSFALLLINGERNDFEIPWPNLLTRSNEDLYVILFLCIGLDLFNFILFIFILLEFFFFINIVDM